jgi:hypothetical protein
MGITKPPDADDLWVAEAPDAEAVEVREDQAQLG